MNFRPKLYADVNLNKPSEYSNYENLDIEWGYNTIYLVNKTTTRLLENWEEVSTQKFTRA